MISKSAMSRTVVAAARTPALLNKAPLAATTLCRSITSFASHSSSSKSSIVATSALPRHWKLLPTYTTYTTTRAMSSNNEKNASFVSSSLFSCKDRIALVTGEYFAAPLTEAMLIRTSHHKAAELELA